MTASKSPKTPLRFSGGVFTLSILHLAGQSDFDFRQELAAQGSALQLLQGAAVVLDLAELDPARPLPFSDWLQILRDNGCFPIAVRHATEEQASAAAKQGLAHLRGNETKSVHPAPDPAPAPVAPSSNAVLSQSLRSGQRHYARGGDLVCLGAVNAGAEVLADGHIHVYGPLRGRALAGVQGEETARIFCQRLEAELIAIAGIYMTLDAKHELWGKAVQVSLDGEHLHIIALENQ